MSLARADLAIILLGKIMNYYLMSLARTALTIILFGNIMNYSIILLGKIMNYYLVSLARAALAGLQKDGNGGNVFPANLRFWQPLLASQLK